MESCSEACKNFGNSVPESKIQDSFGNVNPQSSFQNVMRKGAKATLIDPEISDKFDDIVSGRSVHGKTSRTGRHLDTQELVTLHPKKWFCGAIIEVFLQEIAYGTKTHVFSSYFMTNLRDRGLSFAKQCLRKSLVGIMSSTKLLVPIILNLKKDSAHWALAEIDRTAQSVKYYDSLRFNPGTRLEQLKEFFEEIGYLTKGASVEKLQAIPVQTNTYDCGVFVCEFGRCLIQGKELNFVQDDMPFIRENIKEVLLKTDRFKKAPFRVSDDVEDRDIQEAFENDNLIVFDDDYEFPGFDVDKVINILGEAVSKFNLQDENTTEDVLRRIPPTVDSVSTEIGKLSVSVISGKEATLFARHEENSMKFPPVIHDINVMKQQQMPYIDINSQGFIFTANIHGNWKLSLRLNEALTMIADERQVDMEGAWAVIEQEIKQDPGFALSWLSKCPKPDQDAGPMSFRVGSPKNFKRLANVIHLNHPTIYIENKHSGRGGKKARRYKPYERT